MDRLRTPGTVAGLGFVVALHGGVLAVLLQMDATRSALTAAVPIAVRLITPPEPPQRLVEPPKPLPVTPRVQRPKPLSPPPVLSAAAEAPTTLVAPPPAPEVVPDTPAPAPVMAAQAPASAPAPVAAPAPVTPANFNADYLNNPAPAYPALSRRMGEEGKVILRVFVNEQGLPADVQLKSSSGFSRLDSVAVETVRHWKFVPARRGSDPVAAWVLVPISFSLRS